MKRQSLRRRLGRFTALGVTAAVLLGMAATPAVADTSSATANALFVTLGNSTLLDTGTCAASNAPPATGQCTTGTAQTNLTALVAASLLTQSATASGSSSAACAGLTGPGGGAITIGPSGQCVAPVNPAAAGVVLLGGLINANAVYATCSSTTGAAPTGTSTLLSLNPANTTGPLGSLPNVLGLLGLLTPVTTTSLNGNGTTTSHIVVSLLGATLLTLDLNKQDVTGTPPVLTVTALDLKVLPGFTNLPAVGGLLASLGLSAGSAAEVRVGQITCGPNAVTPPTPAFPLKGAPIAGGIVLLAGFLGWRFWWTPRRRAEQVSV